MTVTHITLANVLGESYQLLVFQYRHIFIIHLLSSLTEPNIHQFDLESVTVYTKTAERRELKQPYIYLFHQGFNGMRHLKEYIRRVFQSDHW
jgi:hypothetical protein